MTTTLNPYLSFGDNAKEAMEFYHSVFGGELVVNTFKEMNASQGPSEDDLVMHSILTTDAGFTLMGSDTPQRVSLTVGDNISVSLSGDNELELRGYWDKLVVGANVTMPLEKAIWGDTFGMCVDKFGISWLVNIA